MKVFGRTSNPYNRKLTAGGSSGGEGSLIALHGSPLGIGTDIGGYVAGFSLKKETIIHLPENVFEDRSASPPA